MKILLVGIDRIPHLGRSFRSALTRMGHEVRVVDPRRAYTVLDRRPLRPFKKRIFGETPSGQALFRLLLRRSTTAFRPDLILAAGACLSADLIVELRDRTAARVAMYSTDNPFNPAVSQDFVRQALPAWDVIATPRSATIPELRGHCSGDVFYLPFGYDPDLHYPEAPSTDAERTHFGSDASFLGGCDVDRVPYLDPLARADDLNVRFFGGYYDFTPALKKRSSPPAYGRDYRLAMGGTKVAICLVRRANADGHVMRTFEAPACGAFLLAERTPDHEEMFREGQEAVFFGSPEEMLDKTRYYARNSKARIKIATGGYRRVTETGNTYEDRLKALLDRLAENRNWSL